jgi:hypothetical protein
MKKYFMLHITVYVVLLYLNSNIKYLQLYKTITQKLKMELIGLKQIIQDEENYGKHCPHVSCYYSL